MKTKGKVLSLISMAILSVCLCFCFTACGGNAVAGTYKQEIAAADLSPSGFLSSMAGTGVITGQTNTLVLNKDNTYELTKEIDFDTTNPAAQGQEMAVKYVFTGTYTYEENKVTLSAATYCTALEKWGAASAYIGEKDNETSDDDADLLNCFATQLWDKWIPKGNVEQTVTVDTENLTFRY